MTNRVPTDEHELAPPTGVPGRPPEVPPNPPGPDIRPPPQEMPDAPNPAEAPILDPPPTPPPPPIMLNVVTAATLRRLCVIAEETIRNLPLTWPTGPACAPVRVAASRRPPPAR